MSEINLQTLHEAVKESRLAYEEIAKKGDPLAREKLAKTEEFIEKQEAKNQTLVAELTTEKKEKEELKTRLNELEIKLASGGLSSKSEEYKEEKSALYSFARAGEKHMKPEEMKFLNTEAGPDGGFLVPTTLMNEIVKKIIEMSNVRSVANVRNMGKLLNIPVRSTLVESGWAGELQPGPVSQSSYAQKRLVAKRLQVQVGITREEMEDSAFDMASQIASDVAEEFARKEGEAFVKGNGGPTVPQGFMTAAGIESFNSGSASALTADSLIHVTGQLKTGYDPMYAFNRRTRAIIRQLKDSVGNYLWVAGNLGGKVPNELNGYPYIEFINMPDVEANAYPIIFGDFRRGYYIGDRQGMFVIRDDVTGALQNTIKFTFTKRTDGIVVLDEAFKKIKISA